MCVATSGGDEGNRTPDIYLAKVALYQLSYVPVLAAARLPVGVLHRFSSTDTSVFVKLATVAADNPKVARAIEQSTILYIEDNISNVKLVERIVEARPNATLLVAMCGGLGLELAFEHSPTMILLDLQLPDISGEEVLRRLRADERTATTSIVVLSAGVTPDGAHALIEAGATGYLTKPFDISRLLELIDGHGSESVSVVETAPVPVTAPLDPRTITALHKLSANLVDGPTQLRQLAELFVHDTEMRLTELTAATREGDEGRIAALAHGLSGSSANLGARALADGCAELEREVKSGGAVGAVARLPGLLASFDEVRFALRAEFSDTRHRT